MKFEKFTNNRRVETSEIIKARVVKARSVQIKRQGKSNSELRSQEVKRYCAIDKECRRFLGEAIAKFRISTRGVIKILKVGRTIADLEGKATMEIVHVAEAFRYRDYGL